MEKLRGFRLDLPIRWADIPGAITADRIGNENKILHERPDFLLLQACYYQVLAARLCGVEVCDTVVSHTD